MTEVILYECGICGGLHPWDWDGDCRDDENRFFDYEDYEERTGKNVVEVRDWSERVRADSRGWLEKEA